MPIKIQSDLPVKEILEKENIFVMDEKRADVYKRQGLYQGKNQYFL